MSTSPSPRNWTASPPPGAPPFRPVEPNRSAGRLHFPTRMTREDYETTETSQEETHDRTE